MDDSERSYGYSQDIYHGQRGAGGHYDRTTGEAPERSYEYGPEGGFGETEDVEMSPEEAAIHIDEQGLSRSGGDERGPEDQYDYGRGGSGGVESFTWESPGPEGATVEEGKEQPTEPSRKDA